ncbi:MAG: hypothetical protein AB1801_20945 [Chloroflexota bacterium]
MMTYWLGYFSILILGCGGLIGLLVYLHRAQKSGSFLENLTLMALTLLLTLLGLEFYFKVFFAESNDITNLAMQNWRDRYYRGAFNSFGYRDQEWTPEKIAGKTKVMVVGDSFVEGVGIKNAADRFPDALGRLLGPDYVVFNLGRRGADTGQEVQDILNYPYPPDILVLSYFVNDIDGIAIKVGLLDPPKAPPIPSLLQPLVENSYAFNFFYWRMMRLALAGQPDWRWQWRLAAYQHAEAWELHRRALLDIYAGTRSQHIPFFVVVFPSITHPEESRVVTDRIVALFEGQGAPVLDVRQLIQGLPSRELTVNAVDSHPNERVHRQVAEALYQMFITAGAVKPTP